MAQQEAGWRARKISSCTFPVDAAQVKRRESYQYGKDHGEPYQREGHGACVCVLVWMLSVILFSSAL